jgi:hypothetical protein
MVFEAVKFEPGGEWLVRTDEAVVWTAEEAAEVLAIKYPVVPQRWGASTVRQVLHDVTRDHLVPTEGRAAEVVLRELRASAQRAAEQGSGERYRPVDPDRWASDAKYYLRRMMRPGGAWKKATRDGHTVDGKRVVVVYMPRFHNIVEAAGAIARVLPVPPSSLGRRTAYEALATATKNRWWAQDEGAVVNTWAAKLVGLGVFPPEARRQASRGRKAEQAPETEAEPAPQGEGVAAP